MASNQKQPQNPPGDATNQDDGDYRICSRCHRRMHVSGLTRSAAETGSENFNLKIMTTCNNCALLQRNQRALGRYKKLGLPKGQSKLDVIDEAEYLRRYGGVVLKGELTTKSKREAVEAAINDDEEDSEDDDEDNDDDGDEGGKNGGADTRTGMSNPW